MDAVVDNYASIVAVQDNVGGLTGNLASNASTDDTSLTIRVKLNYGQEGTIKVFDNGVEIQSLLSMSDNENNALINVPPLSVGAHSLTVKFYNTAGVEQSAAAEAFVVNVVANESTQLSTMTTSASGVDTLTLTTSGQVLDFTKLAATTIDKVDLGSLGGNTVKLNTADVLDAGTGLFTTGGGWVFSNASDGTHASTYHQMLFTGSSSAAGGASTVSLAEVRNANGTSPWALTGTATSAGNVYDVYSNLETNNAQLLISQKLAVTNVVL